MNRIKTVLVIITIAMSTAHYPQTTDPKPTPDDKKKQEDQEKKKENTGKESATGFQGILWSTKYADVKEEFRTLSSNPEVKDPAEIIRDIPDKEILIKRNGIYYRYVFYKKVDPSGKTVSPEESSATPAENQKEEDIPRFFFMESYFPFVPSDQIYNKLKEKYGEKTGASMNKDNSGAYFWETPDGYIVQWVEPYRKAPFTRSIYYISRKIKEEIEKDYSQYNNYRELKAVEKLLP